MTAANHAIVALSEVSARFPGGGADDPNGRLALDHITLSIERGEIFGVIGESGAGKSTLLQMINGLIRPDSGTIRVDGCSLDELGPRELRALRHGIGIVFQSIDLLSALTVRANVALALTIDGRRRSASERDRAVTEILDFVGLSHRAAHYPAQLSGGERQRVGLARALVTRPPLLLCDEPTSSLDAKTTGEVLDVLSSAREERGTTVVLITHDLSVVTAICDRAALLEDGALREVFDIPRTAYRRLPSYAEQVRRELGA